jgi:hypothetical protein
MLMPAILPWIKQGPISHAVFVGAQQMVRVPDASEFIGKKRRALFLYPRRSAQRASLVMHGAFPYKEICDAKAFEVYRRSGLPN